MITLEQIKLLESKITRAIELIRVLKEENGTLRRGLESAQKRMKELETLVEGFKTDQREIESAIVRTLRNLDELEESASAKKGERVAGTLADEEAPDSASSASESPSSPAGSTGPAFGRATPSRAGAAEAPAGEETRTTKEELDIF
jgi:FtsZ-binding cell division protein ZapB